MLSLGCSTITRPVAPKATAFVPSHDLRQVSGRRRLPVLGSSWRCSPLSLISPPARSAETDPSRRNDTAIFHPTPAYSLIPPVATPLLPDALTSRADPAKLTSIPPPVRGERLMDGPSGEGCGKGRVRSLEPLCCRAGFEGDELRRDWHRFERRDK